MDDRRFDNLTRSLAAPRTRRGLIGAFAALGAGLLGVRASGAQVTQVYCGNQACGSNPEGCKPGCVCCAYTNSVGQVTNSRCRPPGTCSPGTQVGGPTPAPTTTTTTTMTTTAAPTTTTTTTTTTTMPPIQGTCPANADTCSFIGPFNCNGNDACDCFKTVAGATVCAVDPDSCCCNCSSDASCGAGRVCVRDTLGDCGCGGPAFTFCATVCPQAT